MKIEPMTGKVIAEPIGAEDTKTQSGIIIPGSTDLGRFIKGKIVAASEEKYIGEKLVPMKLKVGDIIYFDEYTTREFVINAIKYYCLDEDKAYGIIHED